MLIIIKKFAIFVILIHFHIPMKNTLVLFLFLFAFGGLSPIHSQSVEMHAIVTLNDGQEKIYDITEEDLFSFEGQEFLLITAQGFTERISIDNIRKIEFADAWNVEEVDPNTPFFYPNPVRKTLTINNIEDNESISIYSIDGHLVRVFQAIANEPIDLSNLAAGMYTLKIKDKNHKLLKL